MSIKRGAWHALLFFTSRRLNGTNRGRSRGKQTMKGETMGEHSCVKEAVGQSVVMTALEACTHLGIQFSQWRVRQRSFHFGVKCCTVGASPPCGKCIKVEFDPEFQRKIGKWMPKPIRGGLGSVKAVYAVDDVARLITATAEYRWRDQGPILPIALSEIEPAIVPTLTVSLVPPLEASLVKTAPVAVVPPPAPVSTVRVKKAGKKGDQTENAYRPAYTKGSVTGTIPKTYTEMITNFGPFIANEVRSRNTVLVNFEDALQDVHMKLLEAQFLARFWERAENTVCPDVLTADLVCETLGIKFSQWSVRQWAYHRGWKVDGNADKRKHTRWLPTPIQMSGAPEGSCVGYASRKALYRGKDIAILIRDNDDYGWRNQGPIQITHTPPTFRSFLNYLGAAVRNHFQNFCRTRRRKWQDRSGDTMIGNRKITLGENAPQFRTAEGGYNDHWEDTIRDDRAEIRIEAQVAVNKILDRLTERGIAESDQKNICELLASGYTVVEALQKSDLPTAKKKAFIDVIQRAETPEEGLLSRPLMRHL